MSYIDYPTCGNALEMEEAAMGETGECPHCGGEHEGVSFACSGALAPTPVPPWVGQATRIDERALVRASVVMGEGCSIWAFATVHEGVVLGNGVSVGELTYIGRDTRIGDGTRIGAQVHVTDHMEIGRNCFIAPGARFANDNDPKANNPHYRRQSPVVEDDVVICEGAQINPGVRLGRGCRIGSGAVVTRDVPPYETWVGVPARPHVRRR